MSQHDQEIIHSDAAKANLGKLEFAGLLVGLLFTSLSLFLAFTGNSPEGMRSYLFGFGFWSSMTLGMLGVTLLHHTVRGSWGLAILRITEAGATAKTFALLLVLFVPIMLAFKQLYPWAIADNVTKDHILQNRAAWVNPTAVSIRAVLLFAIWGALAYGLRQSSLRQDKSQDEREAQMRMNFSAPGIVLFVLMVTVAVTDWYMSLSPHWYSTMFGPIFVVGPALGTLALATFLVCVNAHKEPYRSFLSPNVTKDLGNMLLTFTLLWAYFNFSQFLIIWNGNLPPTAGYYTARSASHWNAIGCAIIIGQFFVPFFALLSPRMKRYPLNLARIAAWIVVFRVVDIYYTIVPMYRTTGPMPHYQDILAFLGVGGLWVWAFCSEIKKHSLYAEHDQRLMEVAEHAH